MLPITIGQMPGHSFTQIVPRYAKVLDQNRLDAMKKLETVGFRYQETPDENRSKELEDRVRHSTSL